MKLNKKKSKERQRRVYTNMKKYWYVYGVLYGAFWVALMTIFKGDYSFEEQWWISSIALTIVNGVISGGLIFYALPLHYLDQLEKEDK